MPDSVSTYSESILMPDASIRRRMAAEFSIPPDCAAIPESARDALETFSADQLEQSPYSLLQPCPECFKTKSASESGENK